MQSCPGLTGHTPLGHTLQVLPEGSAVANQAKGTSCFCRHLHAHGLQAKFSSTVKISELRQVNRWADLVLLTLMLNVFLKPSFQRLLRCRDYMPPNGCDSPVKVPAALCFLHGEADLNTFQPLTKPPQAKFCGAFFFFPPNLSSQRDTCRADVLRKHQHIQQSSTTTVPLLDTTMNSVTSMSTWVLFFKRFKLPALSNHTKTWYSQAT